MHRNYSSALLRSYEYAAGCMHKYLNSGLLATIDTPHCSRYCCCKRNLVPADQPAHHIPPEDHNPKIEHHMAIPESCHTNLSSAPLTQRRFLAQFRIQLISLAQYLPPQEILNPPSHLPPIQSPENP